jgi:hypothetical protein
MIQAAGKSYEIMGAEEMLTSLPHHSYVQPLTYSMAKSVSKWRVNATIQDGISIASANRISPRIKLIRHPYRLAQRDVIGKVEVQGCGKSWGRQLRRGKEANHLTFSVCS